MPQQTFAERAKTTFAVDPIKELDSSTDDDLQTRQTMVYGFVLMVSVTRVNVIGSRCCSWFVNATVRLIISGLIFAQILTSSGVFNEDIFLLMLKLQDRNE